MLFYSVIRTSSTIDMEKRHTWALHAMQYEKRQDTPYIYVIQRSTYNLQLKNGEIRRFGKFSYCKCAPLTKTQSTPVKLSDTDSIWQ